jgi:dTDP-4-dehydrorhamnose reductase
MKIKVLVVGSVGMAGHVITKMLRENVDLFDVFSISRSADSSLSHFKCDVTDFKSVHRILDEVAPDYIINCVGLLNKTAEDNPADAILVNAYFPHFLESLTKNTQTRIIHISTDCVFSGKRGKYTESDFKDGSGFYAQSKALGEIVNEKDLTIRTSIIGPEISKNGIGLFDWFSKQNGNVSGYVNVYWSGVTTVFLAKFILNIIQDFRTTGLIHLTNNQPISKYDLLELIASVFNWNHVHLVPYENYQSDKSLICTQKEIVDQVPTYRAMVEDMYNWITSHNHLYPYQTSKI